MQARLSKVLRPAFWLALALCLPPSRCLADTLRVTTWNLQWMSVGPDGAVAAGAGQMQPRIPEAAAVLKKLAPDVILLQRVRDWKMCEQLAQALKPADYKVLVCSAFPEAKAGEGGSQQLAVLARQRSYFSWSQPWKSEGAAALPGGFAFAALETRGQRLGFFSVESRGEAPSTRQLLSQVASVRDWVTNRVQVFVVAGTFGTDAVPALEAAGFGDVFPGVSVAERAGRPGTPLQPAGAPVSDPAQRLLSDHIFALPPGCATNSFIASSAGAGHYPVTCDLALDPATIAAGWAAARTEALSRAGSLPPAAASHSATLHPAIATRLRAPALSPGLMVRLALGSALGVGAVVWVVARRNRTSRSRRRGLIAAQAEHSPSAASSYTVVLSAPPTTGPVSAAPGATSSPPPTVHLEAPGLTQTHAEILRQRARAAEDRAAHATAAMRSGLMADLSRWLKQRLLRRLITDRAQLLEAHHAATAKAITVEERLARLERQIQQQNYGYQQRIEELTLQLLAAKEENRELIRAQIRQVKAEMEAARARLMSQVNEQNRG